MNLTATEARILEDLVGKRERYGLEMVKTSSGALKLGSIYVLLGRLEKKGYVESRKEHNPAQVVPRRLYKISGEGARVLHAYQVGMAAYNGALER